MTPGEITILANLLTVLKTMSNWPFGVFFFLMIVGPWVLSLILAYTSRKRFEAVVRMYESNVKLVDDYNRVATDLKDVIILSTQTMTKLAERIKQL